MNARLETRLLAMGVSDSIYAMSGRIPRRSYLRRHLIAWGAVVLIAAVVIAASQ